MGISQYFLFSERNRRYSAKSPELLCVAALSKLFFRSSFIAEFRSSFTSDASPYFRHCTPDHLRGPEDSRWLGGRVKFNMPPFQEVPAPL
jgi:hypothetical protein